MVPTTGSGRCTEPSAPDPDPLLRIEIQRVVLADVERVIEGVDIANDAVAAELRRRMRVDSEPSDRFCHAGFGAPHLGPTEKNSLYAGEAVDHRRLPFAQ